MSTRLKNDIAYSQKMSNKIAHSDINSVVMNTEEPTNYILYRAVLVWIKEYCHWKKILFFII